MSPDAPGAEERHWLRLTTVCNQRCLFCLDRDAQDGGFVEWEALRREMSEARSRGLKRVVLSGGEPTIHPRFLEAVGAARELGFERIQVITNGRRFCYPDFLRKAQSLGLSEATFSLHGHTRELHERLTRTPGSFLQALAGLGNALSLPGMIVSVDVVITKLNLGALREILDFYLGLGAREFDLLRLTPTGDAWRHWGELYCDFSDPENLASLRRALELSRRPGVRIWTNRLAPEFLEGYEDLIQPPEKLLDELRGRYSVFRRFLAGLAEPECAGPQCRHCALEGLCSDLKLLRRCGRLEARPGPLCRGSSDSPREPFLFSAGVDIFDFGRFYIEARHFAKGAACGSCSLQGACDGILVDDLRRLGFAGLRPC
ncbi:MAG: radical SAM protein [Elusimicrobia bacterium]|nr:radical SAM protein [Elusimicrobiota bacterium]